MLKQVVLFTVVVAVAFPGTESSAIPKYTSWENLYSAVTKELSVTTRPVVDIPDFYLNLTSYQVLMGELNVTRATVSDLRTMAIAGITGTKPTPPNASEGSARLEVTISWDRLSILGSTEIQMFGAQVSGYLNMTFMDKPLLVMRTVTEWNQDSCKHKIERAEFMNSFPVEFQLTPISEFNRVSMKGVIQQHRFKEIVSMPRDDILGIPLFKIICSKILPEQ